MSNEPHPKWTHLLGEYELEALSHEELLSYLAWQGRVAAAEAAVLFPPVALPPRRIITDDDFYLQGDYDRCGSYQNSQWGE